MQSKNNQRVYYTYAHYTLDTNILFYIGVGTILNTKTQKEKSRYSRAYHSKNRNKYWQNVSNKHGFRVKILEHFSTKEYSLFAEKKLIAKYGKRLDKGLLVNMSDGGEIGPIGRTFFMSKEQKDKLSEIKSITLYVYNAKTGLYLESIKSIKETAKYCGVTYNAIHSCLQTKHYSNGFFIFKKYLGDTLDYTAADLDFTSPLKKEVEISNKEISKKFPSIAECARFLKRERASVRQALKKGNKCAGYYVRTISSQDPK